MSQKSVEEKNDSHFFLPIFFNNSFSASISFLSISFLFNFFYSDFFWANIFGPKFLFSAKMAAHRALKSKSEHIRGSPETDIHKSICSRGNVHAKRLCSRGKVHIKKIKTCLKVAQNKCGNNVFSK